MMKLKYVTYQQSQDLKKLGYDLPCERYYLLQEKTWWRWRDSKCYFMIQGENSIRIGKGIMWPELKPLRVMKNLLQEIKKYRGYKIQPIPVYSEDLVFLDCRFIFFGKNHSLNLNLSWSSVENVKKEIDKLYPIHVPEKTIIKVVE